MQLIDLGDGDVTVNTDIDRAKIGRAGKLGEYK
jgi:hypothetical protein